MSATVQAVRLTTQGEPVRAQPTELAEPGADEVLVQMRFGGVNPIDRYIAEGRVAPDGPLPRTLGSEGTGVLDGRTVLVAGNGLGAARDGVWAEQAVVPRDSVTPVPDGVSAQAAAAMGIAGLTAWTCATELAQVGPADRVAVFGASGGVGTMLVHLAKAAGATVYGHTGSEAKRAFVAAQGTDRVLVGDAERIAPELARFEPTVVFDGLGGGFVGASIEALAPHGRHVSYGTSADVQVAFNMQMLYRKMITVFGYGGMTVGGEERRRGLQAALHALAEGRIRVAVDEVLPLGRVAEAFERLVDRRVRGKLLLALGE